jgi:hypothetical protein
MRLSFLSLNVRRLYGVNEKTPDADHPKLKHHTILTKYLYDYHRYGEVILKVRFPSLPLPLA